LSRRAARPYAEDMRRRDFLATTALGTALAFVPPALRRALVLFTRGAGAGHVGSGRERADVRERR
jgi:hypothetical protein